jgi:carboxypeptidase T
VKRFFLSFLVSISMILGMVSSALATPATVPVGLRQTLLQTPQYSIIKVNYTSHDELNALASRYDVIQVDQSAGIAYLLVTDSELAALQLAGYQLEVDEAKTLLLNQPHLALPGQGPDSIPGYPCYRTVEETYSSLQTIATNYPDLAQLFDIGESWDKVTPGGNSGYDILALRLTDADPRFGNLDSKPTFFLMAEIHAREYATAELATRYAEYLVNNYGTNPDITWLLDYFRVYIVSMTNPDGRKIAETGLWWRKNVDNNDGCTDSSNWGTDLNRNNSFKWAFDNTGSDPSPCGETFRGPSAASEPETQAIQNFVLSIFSDQRGTADTDPAPANTTGMLLSLHSASSLVLWPWGFTDTDSPNATQLRTLGRHLAFFNHYFPEQSYDLYGTNGTTDDWSYGELGIASFTFELAGQFFQPCSTFNNIDFPENRDALVYAFKSARRPFINPAGPESLNLSLSPIPVPKGVPALLTATANDKRFNNNNGSEPYQNISASHYSIDAPSWITDTVTFPMVASDGVYNNPIENIQAIIDTSNLTVGRHTVFVESQDANGNWGVTSAVFLDISEPEPTVLIFLPIVQSSWVNP